MPTDSISWSEALRVYLHPRVVTLFFLGFSAGLPLLLVFSTLSAWLADMNVSRTAIGFFGWVGITYSIKVLWAPVVDRLPLPLLTRRLGQRRSWMLAGQIGVVIGLLGMAMTDPQQQLVQVALLALLVAFSSSTQDVAIDAFRIEAAITEYQGAMASTYILGYRIAMLVAGAGALYIADFGSWPLAYLCMALLMGVGVITVLLISEPAHPKVSESELIEQELHHKVSGGNRALNWFVDAVVAPFVEFFRRNGRFALLILLFIGLFRLSDIVMGIMANPFYLDLGFSKSDIASIGKVFGFFMTIAGSFLGGLLVVRYGVFRPLVAGAVLVALTNLLFAQLSLVGPELPWLALVISADNLSGGFSNAVFIAYLSGLTNRAYTATQYALFSSVMTLPGKFVSGFSGVIVDASSYTHFFIYAAVMGIPAIILAIVLMRRESR
ncbi:AmpG family muropeptide MFS transporter [Pseudomaricurvus alkylphenolicus]|uniref:AmpG family muropeptide MFS transporter n=1 Tax=Pseudomaricurvus alkylphenolicus TaxID=1306991 RepID=UPI001420BB2B|nr:MFS transporter [Pseudomaricurvus alkylphenolicus]NIB40010.1 AmpG family muropeptide MFS transporter [Pseudomaricurvus alkylphenolicus]